MDGYGADDSQPKNKTEHHTNTAQEARKIDNQQKLRQEFCLF